MAAAEQDISGEASKTPMDPEAFRVWGKRMVDYAADYWQTLRERKPLPAVNPGYMWELVPKDPPQEPEPWEAIFGDLESVVLSGVSF